MSARLLPGGLACVAVILLGQIAHPDDQKAPEVQVIRPVRRQVTDFANFTGRTEAQISVEMRARVSGYLLGVRFKEGQEVRHGDLLFEIDPRPYQAELDKAQAEVALAEARLRQATAERARAQQGAAASRISPGELDKAVGKADAAQATLRLAQAGLEAAQLNLSFTKVTSPIDGVIGRSFLSPGNVVKADTTVLARIVTLDPIYVYFDMDEATLLHLRRGMNNARPAPGGQIPVTMGLQGEKDYPHEGLINFVDNQVNPQTGAITVRCIFPNPKLANGVRLMLPGMFARIRMPMGQPYHALLVPQKAIGSDNGQRFLWVVGSGNKLEQHRVTVGQSQSDGLRVIAAGIQEGDRVVVGDSRKLRVGEVVSPKLIERPTDKER